SKDVAVDDVDEVLQPDEPIARVEDGEGADAVIDGEEKRQRDQNKDIEDRWSNEERADQLRTVEQEPGFRPGGDNCDRSHADISALGASGVAPIPIEIAQLRFAHREHVPSARRNAVERRMRGQLGRDLAFRGSAVERAIQDMLRAEVLHAVDAEPELDDRTAPP